jgi:hypothetical protein
VRSPLHIPFVSIIYILPGSSAFTLSALTLLSTSLVPAWRHTVFWTTVPFSNVQWLASALAIYAALSYILDAPADTAQSKGWPPRRSLILLGLTIAPMLAIIVASPLTRIPHKPSFVWNNVTASAPLLMPHQYDVDYNVTDTSCKRRPLPHSSSYIGPGVRPNFPAFDDILLVVFFSHDRYDINLDGYREVYSRYFPNVCPSCFRPHAH